MAIGPVQLIVLGFSHPDFHGEIIAELERLRDSDAVRVIDALAVHKDAAGEIEVAHLSNLSKDEAIELGSKVGALIGLGIEGEEGMAIGAEAGAEAADDGVSVFSDEEAWDVIEEIPNDSAAALILLEHHWAVPLRDAIARAGGFRISDGFISPLDLVEIGLASREEADAAACPRDRRPAHLVRPIHERSEITMFGSRRVARRTSTARRASPLTTPSHASRRQRRRDADGHPTPDRSSSRARRDPEAAASPRREGAEMKKSVKDKQAPPRRAGPSEGDRRAVGGGTCRA